MNRRDFVGALAAGTAGLATVWPRLVEAEPPPETTTLRLVHVPSISSASTRTGAF